MNRTTEHKKKVKNCPRCNSTEISKAGIVKQKQRFRCKSCSYCFRPSLILEDKSLIEQAYLAYKKTNHSIQKISENFGLKYRRVYKWMRKPYCENPRNQWNPFAKVGATRYMLKDIEKGLKKYRKLQLKVRYYQNQATIYVFSKSNLRKTRIFTMSNPRYDGAGGIVFILKVHIVAKDTYDEYRSESVFGNRVEKLDSRIKVSGVSVEEFFEKIIGSEENEEENLIAIESFLEQYYNGMSYLE